MITKEELNRLLCMAKKGCKVDMCNVKYVENASDIIKQDLDRLEKLEKENKKLKEIIKENFTYYFDTEKVDFNYKEPYMEKEILEVLEDE